MEATNGSGGSNIFSICKVSALRQCAPLVLVLYYLANGIVHGAASALKYEKICLQNFNSTVCATLKHYPEAEDVVQAQTATLMLWYKILHHVPSLICMFLYGSLSDHFSRKAIIALPLFGHIIGGIIHLMNAIYMSASPYWLLPGSFAASFTGGGLTLLMGVYTYIGVTSESDEERTRRILIAEGVSSVTTAVADAASGVFLDNTSFITVFSVDVGISFLAFFYAAIILQNPKKASVNKIPNTENSNRGDLKDKVQRMIKKLLRTITHSLKCVFKKRDGNLRLQIMACLGVVFGSMISSKAHRVQYLFFRRRPLSWSQTTYGIFSSVNHVLPGLALLTLVPLLRRKFHLRDTTLIALGIASGGFSELFLAFSTKTWMVFVVPFIGIFHDATWIIRSVISGLVQEDELGGIFAVFGAIQNLSGVVATIMYNKIYPATLKTWHGLVFALGAIIAFITFLLHCWLHRSLKNPSSEDYTSLQSEDTQNDEDDGSSEFENNHTSENAASDDDQNLLVA